MIYMLIPRFTFIFLRTKSDQIFNIDTRNKTRRGFIKGIGISFRTIFLEESRIFVGPTRLCVSTWTLARHHTLIVRWAHLQGGGAHGVEVFRTAHNSTRRIIWAYEWFYGDGDVVAIHETHIVELFIILYRKADNGGWRDTAKPVAVEAAATVSRYTFATARGIKIAAQAAPNTAWPEPGIINPMLRVRREEKAPTGHDRVLWTRMNPGPDWVGTIVDKFYPWSPRFGHC